MYELASRRSRESAYQVQGHRNEFGKEVIKRGRREDAQTGVAPNEELKVFGQKYASTSAKETKQGQRGLFFFLVRLLLGGIVAFGNDIVVHSDVLFQIQTRLLYSRTLTSLSQFRSEAGLTMLLRHDEFTPHYMTESAIECHPHYRKGVLGCMARAYASESPKTRLIFQLAR
ncbi:hypothetical protein BC826DRAFT_1181759 [Russula brevipes]|nr:hypothetical protein BC826DRAFT_1181759 [Russula brevipes]